jgi:hypothetical protein
MAATGEPYSVAARALDAEPIAAGPVAAEPMTAGSAAAGPAADAESAASTEPDAHPAGALAEVIACAGRTLTAPSARLQIRDDTETGQDPEPAPRPRPGLVGRLAGRAAKRLLGPASDISAAEFRQLFMHQFGAGFIEPAAGRYLVDFGAYAQMLVDGRRFGGLSGEPLGPRYEIRPHRFRRDDPFDALRKLQRATAARWAGTEQVRSTTCRVITATVGADEFTVWIDGQHVQRFQTVERGSGRHSRATKTETVELWDYGVPTGELDWSRLPAFRTDRSGDHVTDP